MHGKFGVLYLGKASSHTLYIATQLLFLFPCVQIVFVFPYHRLWGLLFYDRGIQGLWRVHQFMCTLPGMPILISTDFSLFHTEIHCLKKRFPLKIKKQFRVSDTYLVKKNCFCWQKLQFRLLFRGISDTCLVKNHSPPDSHLFSSSFSLSQLACLTTNEGGTGTDKSALT